MTDEDFKKGLDDLTEMIAILRRIKDRSRRKWLKADIRFLLRELMKD